MQTLRQDSRWLTGVAQAGNRGSDNPIFKYAVARWGNILIYQDDLVARLSYALTTATLDFFDYDLATLQADSVGMYEKVQKPADAQNTANALLLGKSSIAEGLFTDLKYPHENVDHEMITSIGSSRYYGLARMDYYDEELTTAP